MYIMLIGMFVLLGDVIVVLVHHFRIKKNENRIHNSKFNLDGLSE